MRECRGDSPTTDWRCDSPTMNFFLWALRAAEAFPVSGFAGWCEKRRMENGQASIPASCMTRVLWMLPELVGLSHGPVVTRVGQRSDLSTS